MTILKTVGLSKNFKGLRAVDKLDFSVEQGTIHGLIGPNGSGKTTFFNLVSGLLRATEGKIYFESTDITNFQPNNIVKIGIGRTFQRAHIMDKVSVLDNVMAGLHCHTNADIFGTLLRVPLMRSAQETEMRKKAMELLDYVGITDLAERLASQLVWVETQLMQIARALATKPKLLLLDEPTAGMGPAETALVQGIIKRIKETGVTVIVVSHDIRFVTTISDRITVIEFGKKVTDGTSSEILNHPRVMEAYLGKKE
jgi:branched-chain amino acid transport system ATP-binding protein